MKALALLAIPALFVLSGFAYADDTLAILNTEQGRLVLEFFPQDAPDNVSNFVTLAKSGFYNDTLLHGIVPGLIIQGGEQNIVSGVVPLVGTSDTHPALKAEFNDIMHARGIVSTFIPDDPNDTGSQFLIVQQDAPYLDGEKL